MEKNLKALKTDLNKIIEFAKEGIVSKTIVDNPKVKYILFCLEKRQKLSEHKAPFNAGIYVIKGKGEFLLGKESCVGSCGSFFHMPSGLIHAIVALQDLVFLLIMVKS